MGYLSYNGVSSASLGLIVAEKPDYPAPEREENIISIPGRNGDLHISTGAYKNIKISYQCWFRGGPTEAHAIKSWLLGGSGYCKLSDSYDSDHYRKAHFAGPQDISNALGRGEYGELTISFDCRPEMFDVSGDTAVEFTATGTLTNPEAFPSRPLIRVYGTGSIAVNGYTCTIRTNADYTDIDCETMQAYKGTENLNANVSIMDFPMLGAGVNNVVLDGITKAEITPRWWAV